MILTDVIKLRNDKTATVPSLAEVQKIIEELAGFESFGKRYAFTDAHQDALSGIKKKVIANINARRAKILNEHGSLGHLLCDPWTNEKDLLGLIAETPKTTLAAVRELTDAVGFVVIPFDYLDPRSYEEESYEMTSQIKKFSQLKGARGRAQQCYAAP